MIPVVRLPKSGSPEDNSKTEPTPAIAVIQQRASNIPLFGVIDATLIFLPVYFIFAIE
jgi:hypothetical protein